MPAWNDMHYAQCLDLWRVEFDTSQKPSTDGRALCVITGVLYALGGVPSHVKKLQHYPRSHVGHRRSHGLINRRVSERIYTRRAWVLWLTCQRECAQCLWIYARTHYPNRIFSILNFQNAEKKSRQMRAFVWEFLDIAPVLFLSSHLCTLPNPFICVYMRITLFALMLTK